MKTCIFYSIYGNPKYSDILDMSLASCAHHVKDTDIFVYHDGVFHDPGSARQFTSVVKPFPDGQATKMTPRYLFAADLLEPYDRVLHLDTDTIVTGELGSVFSSAGQGLS